DLPGAAFAATVSADIWHRRLGHLNPGSMDLLRKKEGNGIEYADSMSACDICALSKSRQQAHPKTAENKTTGPMDLVGTDLMGPFSPPAKGGFRFAAKYTDYHTHMKEVFLL
ncbi:unnamed protein product, partial [Pylaiella littoralis]